MSQRIFLRCGIPFLTGLSVVLGSMAADSGESKSGPPVKVTIQDEKPLVVEPVLPIDLVKRVQSQPSGNMDHIVRVDNKTMHLGSINTLLHINGQVVFPGQGGLGRMEVRNQRLKPKTESGKPRDGWMSVYTFGTLRVTQTVEVAGSK